MLKDLNVLLKDKKSVWFMLSLLFIGIILLSIDTGESRKAYECKDSKDIDEYIKKLEYKLENTLSKIEGVGKVSVMITLEGTEETVYAQDKKESSDYFKDLSNEGNERKNTDNQRNYVFTDAGSERNALKLKSIEPSIRGAAVICEGGDSAVIRSSVTEAVSIILGIKYNQIFVAKLN